MLEVKGCSGPLDQGDERTLSTRAHPVLRIIGRRGSDNVNGVMIRRYGPGAVYPRESPARGMEDAMTQIVIDLTRVLLASNTA
jgi:hypothetical protein